MEKIQSQECMMVISPSLITFGKMMMMSDCERKERSWCHFDITVCYPVMWVSPPDEDARARVSEVMPIRNVDFHNPEEDRSFYFSQKFNNAKEVAWRQWKCLIITWLMDGFLPLLQNILCTWHTRHITYAFFHSISNCLDLANSRTKSESPISLYSPMPCHVSITWRQGRSLLNPCASLSSRRQNHSTDVCLPAI